MPRDAPVTSPTLPLRFIVAVSLETAGAFPTGIVSWSEAHHAGQIPRPVRRDVTHPHRHEWPRDLALAFARVQSRRALPARGRDGLAAPPGPARSCADGWKGRAAALPRRVCRHPPHPRRDDGD